MNLQSAYQIYQQKVNTISFRVVQTILFYFQQYNQGMTLNIGRIKIHHTTPKRVPCKHFFNPHNLFEEIFDQILRSDRKFLDSGVSALTLGSKLFISFSIDSFY